MGISNCYDGTGNLLNLPGEPGEGGIMADEISEVEEFEWTEEKEYRFLKAYIMGDNPHNVAILAARWVATSGNPVNPDWVMALANGNPDEWDALLVEVRHLIEYDERREAK